MVSRPHSTTPPPITQSPQSLLEDFEQPVPGDEQQPVYLDNDTVQSRLEEFEFAIIGKGFFISRAGSDASDTIDGSQIQHNNANNDTEECKEHLEEFYQIRDMIPNVSPSISTHHHNSLIESSLNSSAVANLNHVESEELGALRASAKASIQQVEVSKEYMEWLEIALGPNLWVNNKLAENIFKIIENNNEQELNKYLNDFFTFQINRFREKYILQEYLKYIQTEQAKFLPHHEKQLNKLQNKQTAVNEKINNNFVAQSREKIELMQERLKHADAILANPRAYSKDQLLNLLQPKSSPSINNLDRSLKDDITRLAAEVEMYSQISQKAQEVAAYKLYWENEALVCQQLIACYQGAYNNHLMEITNHQLDSSKTREILTAYSAVDSLKKHQENSINAVTDAPWGGVPFSVMISHSLHTSRTKLFDHDYIGNPKAIKVCSANDLIDCYAKILKIPATLEMWITVDEAEYLKIILDSQQRAIIKSIVNINYSLAHKYFVDPLSQSSTNNNAAEQNFVIEKAKEHHELHLTKLWKALLKPKRWETCVDKATNNTNLTHLEQLFPLSKKISLESLRETAKEKERLRYASEATKWLTKKAKWLESNASMLFTHQFKKKSPIETAQAFINAQGAGTTHALFNKASPKAAELVDVAFSLYLKSADDNKHHFIKVLSVLFQHGAALPTYFITDLNNNPSTKHWQLVAEYLNIAYMYSPLAAKLSEQLATYVKEMDNTLHSLMYWPSRLFMSLSAVLMNHSHLLYVAGITKALQNSGTHNEEIFAILQEVIDSENINITGGSKNSKLKEIATEINKQLESRALLAFPRIDEMKEWLTEERKRDAAKLQQVTTELKNTRAENAAMKIELEQTKKEQLQNKLEFDVKLEQIAKASEVKYQQLFAMIAVHDRSPAELMSSPGVSDPIVPAAVCSASFFKSARVPADVTATPECTKAQYN